MSNLKILFYLDHAPDYREAFLQNLSQYYNLTVIAHSCEKDGLKPPAFRKGYKYIELNKTIGNKIRLNVEFSKILGEVKPDVICVALNLRYPFRILKFLTNIELRKKWIWWGQIYGRNNNPVFNKLKIGLIRKSAGALVYTDNIVNKLGMKNIQSFDNSQYSHKDYVKLKNDFKNSVLKCLFVGRPQPRKRLEIIINIAQKRKDLFFRLVGPGMIDYFKDIEVPSNVELFPAAHGKILRQHFKWSNLIVNPGHLGLLVMNSASHNRAIVIDSKVNHAPEVILAKKTNQYFIDFTDDVEVNNFFDELIENPTSLISKGEQLFKYSIKKYTIEEMVRKHRLMFDRIIAKK